MTIAFSRRPQRLGLGTTTATSRVLPATSSFRISAPFPSSGQQAIGRELPLKPTLLQGTSLAHQFRQFTKLAYLLVRPVIRPLAWRTRSFLLREMSQSMGEMRLAQDAVARNLQSLVAHSHGLADVLAAGGQLQAGGLTGGRPHLVRLRRKVHQFHAGSAAGDAITNAMLMLQRQLRMMGYESEIFVESLGAGLEGKLQRIDALPMHDDHVLLVHHSMGHACFSQVAASPAPKILIYHNITPADLLGHNVHMQRASELGRRQLVQWGTHVVAALADSVFNGMELRHLGFPCVLESTLLFDVEVLRQQVLRHVRQTDAPFTVLFVGRVTPSKGQAELVDAFAAFAQRWRGHSTRPIRLVLAGAEQSCSSTYGKDLESRVRGHGLGGDVVLTGKLSDDALHACYAQADLYVSLSQHEGFGVPLVEAMAHGVPVLALAVGAVAATLGPAAELLHDTSPETVAEAIFALACDPQRLSEVAKSQHAMLETWSLERHLPALHRALALAGAAPIAVPETRDTIIANLAFTIAGHVNGSYSLAAVNRRLALSLEAAHPGRVRLLPIEAGRPASLTDVPAEDRADFAAFAARHRQQGSAVVKIFQHYPLLTPEPDDTALAMLFWEESVLPQHMVHRLNTSYRGVLAPTDSVARALFESGVHVPVRVVGFAPELTAYAALGNERRARPAIRSRYTFLHVSSCFPRKGVDALLSAWARAFRATDPVRLVIKGFPNPHNDIAARIARLRSDDPEIAEIILVDDDIDACSLLDLYRQADAMVLPTRGEGFNIPAAEAMVAGLHLIVTAHGGHMDFCADDDANVRLVSYRMAPAASHLAAPHAMWAEPDPEDLLAALQEAVSRSPVVQAAPVALLQRLNSANWAHRIADATAEILLQPPSPSLRMAWVSPWQVRCGVAEYSSHLLGGFPKGCFAASHLPLVLTDQRPALQQVATQRLRIQSAFRLGDEASVPGLVSAIAADEPDVLVVQHQPGLLPWPALAELLEQQALVRRCTVVTLHNVRDLLHSGPGIRERVGSALAGITRVVVHAVGDVSLLQDLGVNNAVWLPHGSTLGPKPRPPAQMPSGAAPMIGTTGFVLPHKQINRLITATGMLRRAWPKIRLRLVTAAHPDPTSEQEMASCERLIAELGLTEIVEWHVAFEPNERVLSLLSECDLIVMPYAPTRESSSGAVRQAIASGVPTIVSDLPLFDDLGAAVERLPQTTPEAIARGVATLLRDPLARAGLQDSGQAWLAAHDWSVIGDRLHGMLAALHAEHRRQGTLDAEYDHHAPMR